MGMVESQKMDSSYTQSHLHKVGYLAFLQSLGFFYYTNVTISRFGDLKLQNPDNRAFAQMFQKTYAGKILECHLNFLNVVRIGGYLPDRVTNLILQYLNSRFVVIFIYLQPYSVSYI